MKKRIVIFMAFALLLTACSSNSEPPQTTANQTAGQETSGNPEAADIKWPERPIQFVVGANPGGGIDTAARLMAKYLEAELGQTIVVSNIAGGAGSVAARQVKDAQSDGYTALVCHDALLTNRIAETTEFDYDGFASGGVGLKVFSTAFLSKDYTTFEELVEAAKENPGKVRFGTEIATNDTAVIAMMENELDIQIQIVDNGAVSDQIGAMMGGHIDFMKAPVGLVSDYVESGDFHILGFFNEERLSSYPDIPTMKELGIDFVVDKFYYVGFPLGTDQAIIDKFSSALKQVTENPDYIAEAEGIDYSSAYVAPEDIPEYFEKCKERFIKYQELIDNRIY